MKLLLSWYVYCFTAKKENYTFHSMLIPCLKIHTVIYVKIHCEIYHSTHTTITVNNDSYLKLQSLLMSFNFVFRLGYARVSHGGLSDTELQMARFRIPEQLDNYHDIDRLVIDDTSVDPSLHFSSRYIYHSLCLKCNTNLICYGNKSINISCIYI